MSYKKPEKTALTYWRVKRTIGLLVLIVIFSLVWLAGNGIGFLEKGTTLRTITAAVMLVILAYQAISIFVYPAIEYRQWEYAIEDDRVVIKHGLFFISRTVIPIIRIQNVNTNQGPIQRLFHLYSVELALASGTFDIVGLSRETAEDISEKLNSRLHMRLKANAGSEGKAE